MMSNTTTSSTAPAPVAFHVGDYANILTALMAMSNLGNGDAPYWDALADKVRDQIEYESRFNLL
jgi:hypothetical protein